MLYSAENRTESSMFAKRFVFSESREGFDKNYLEKSRIVSKKRRS